MSQFSSSPFDAGFSTTPNNGTELKHLPYQPPNSNHTAHNNTNDNNHTKLNVLNNEQDADMFYNLSVSTPSNIVSGKIDSAAAPVATPVPLPSVQQSTDNTYTNSHFYQLKYYQQYFDVDTHLVRHRLLRSIDCIHRFYDADNTEQPQHPDLYTPFWLCTTLCFIVAVTSNIADYINYKQTHNNTTESSVDIWQQDVSKTSMSTTVLYSYLLLWPIILYFIFRKLDTSHHSLMHIISITGYGLISYVIASILAIYPNTISRWIVISIACVHSSTFTVRNLYDSENKKIVPALLCIVGVNVAIALMLRLYFFGFSL